MAEEEKSEKQKAVEEAKEGKQVEERLLEWKPKTELGRKVLKGEITDIREILEQGLNILEPEIVDFLVPNLKSELILIGGRTGKGGGIQRIPIRVTAKMHHSGRRYSMTAFAVVGNEDGIVGIGMGKAREARLAIEKAIRNAKKNLILVDRGCGSWECRCGGTHSIPHKTVGKSGSVRVVLMPAPKGVGLVAPVEAKKILRLAGIKDVWMKTFGDTRTRFNFITAIYRALKKLHAYKRKSE